MASSPQAQGVAPGGSPMTLRNTNTANAPSLQPPAGQQSNGTNGSNASHGDKNGYPDLAKFMALDDGMLQFKRFAELNAHSLLMQQAEILVLEEDLKAQAVRDRRTLGTKYDTEAEELMKLDSNKEHSEQWQLILKIRTRLKEYNKALLRQSELCKLSQPRKYDTKQLREWLARKTGGDNFLLGVEEVPWLPEDQQDLLAITKEPFDALTGGVAETLVPWITKIRQKLPLIKKTLVPGHEEVGLVDHPDQKYRVASRGVIVLFSALTPSLAILILYHMRNMLARIMTAMGLSLVFAASLASSTEVRPSDVFGATAAFAAVQVVFIGSNNITNAGV